MTISIAPPPLSIPPDFVTDKIKQGFFSALLNTLYQLWTEVYGIRTKNTTKTTDATPTGVVRISIPTDTTVYIESKVVGRRTGGSAGAAGDSAWYSLIGGFKNIAGVVSVIAANLLDGGEDQAAWNCQYAIDGEYVVLTVTGAANNNITWNSTVSTYGVGG